MNELDLGWLAGLFEGEGSTGVYGRGVSAYIAMTDPDVLERVEALFPSPTGIRCRERRGGHKPIYEWRIRQRDQVAEFLELILPILGWRRKARALEVLRRATDPLGGLGSGHPQRTSLLTRQHAHQRTGIPSLSNMQARKHRSAEIQLGSRTRVA